MNTTKRTNLSLPIELYDRMQKFKGRVNWSAVAASAFEEEIERLASSPKHEPITLLSLAKRVERLERIST